uniref:Zinc finger CHCC-type domain-containing protein n=1 Tax=Cuerna arida TaxID=1464854 RepID=A0A1B6FLE8_9HEMI
MALNLLSKSLKLNSAALKPLSVIRNKSTEQSWIPDDPVTHTGQKYEENDYRLARYVERKKHVNTNFAIDLIAAVPPKPEKARIVWCDGGGGPLGHPKVYINLDKPGDHTCGYCGLRFFKEDGHGHGH